MGPISNHIGPTSLFRTVLLGWWTEWITSLVDERRDPLKMGIRPFGGIENILLAPLCDPCRSLSVRRNELSQFPSRPCPLRWAVVELICSWTVSHGCGSWSKLIAVTFRSWVPFAVRIAFTDKWTRLPMLCVDSGGFLSMPRIPSVSTWTRTWMSCFCKRRRSPPGTRRSHFMALNNKMLYDN